MLRTVASHTKNFLPQNTRGFFTIIDQNERGIRLGFGKFKKVLEPGIRWNIPIYHTVWTVNVTHRVQDIPPQSLISKDNVSFSIDGSFQYQVVDPKKALLEVEDYRFALQERCKMQLRNDLSSMNIDDILHHREGISNRLIKKMEDIPKDWGIVISQINIRDISFEADMRRAMAAVAEADRNAKSKIINAEADVKTAEQYARAAEIYKENPVTMRLRELQVLSQVSKNGNSTVFVPTSVMDSFKKY